MTITFDQLGNHGRLGNCLFQIAATIGHARRHGVDYEFPNWEYQNEFCVPQEKFVQTVKFDRRYHEPSFTYTEISPPQGDVSLFGYFQSERYFASCRDEVKSLLTPRSCITDDFARLKSSRSDTCGIHIRRGDYLLKPDFHTNLDMNYYNSAIEIMKSRGVKKFVVACEDPAWARENFRGDEFEHISAELQNLVGSGVLDRRNVLADFAELVSCGHSIIANSSFSWWTSFLGEHHHVVAPKNWFGPKMQHPIHDMILSHWTMI